MGTKSNTYAIGSKIKVYKGNDIYYREVVPSRGFQSSVDYKQVIGLGKLTGVDSMMITWPDRTTTTYKQPELNKTHQVQQPANNNKPADIATTNTNALLQLQPTIIMSRLGADGTRPKKARLLGLFYIFTSLTEQT